MNDFKKLGYLGNTISGLDPGTDGFHNFGGLRVNLVCSMEKDLIGAQVDAYTSIDHSMLEQLDDLLKSVPNGSPVKNRFGRADHTDTGADPFFVAHDVPY